MLPGFPGQLQTRLQCETVSRKRGVINVIIINYACSYMCTCAYVCGSQISTFSAASQAHSALFLETRSLIDLELTE